MRARVYAVVLGLLVLAVGARTVGAAAVVLPAGTALNIRTTQPIDSGFAHGGITFDAVVDDPVAVGGQILIERGAAAKLEVARVERSARLKGGDHITFKVHSLNVAGRTYAVATNYVEVKGWNEGKRARNVVGGAGIGMPVEGQFGNGSGTPWAATAGGNTAAIMAGTGNTHLRVPPDTRLHFQLTAATWIEP
jgi:hypothetical protein